MIFLSTSLFGQSLPDLISGEKQYLDNSLFDPLNFVLPYLEGRKLDKKAFPQEKNVLNRFTSYHIEGNNLSQSCNQYEDPDYFLPEHRERLIRILLNSYQDIGLNLSTRGIIYYLKKLEKSGDEVESFVENLVQSSCSKNITNISQETLKQRFFQLIQYGSGLSDDNLQAFPEEKEYIDSLLVDELTQLRRGLNLAIKSFQNFCSWGNDIQFTDLIGFHLDDPAFASYVIRKIVGVELIYDQKRNKVGERKLPKEDTVHFICDGLICRKTDFFRFTEEFPSLLGSKSIRTDLEKVYCKDLRNIPLRTRNKDSIIGKKQKSVSLDERKLYQSFLSQLVTGMPDFFHRVDTFASMKNIFFLPIQASWDIWSKKVLRNFKLDIPFEESLYISQVDSKYYYDPTKNDFRIDFVVGLGEFDRMLYKEDKITAFFNLTLSKDLLRWVRQRTLNRTLEDALKDKTTRDYLKLQIETDLKKMSSKFALRPWDSGIENLIIQELIFQVSKNEGSFFKTYNAQKVTIPIYFHYGLFALKYLNFKLNSLEKNQNLLLDAG